MRSSESEEGRVEGGTTNASWWSLDSRRLGLIVIAVGEYELGRLSSRAVGEWGRRGGGREGECGRVWNSGMGDECRSEWRVRRRAASGGCGVKDARTFGLGGEEEGGMRVGRAEWGLAGREGEGERGDVPREGATSASETRVTSSISAGGTRRGRGSGGKSSRPRASSFAFQRTVSQPRPSGRRAREREKAGRGGSIHMTGARGGEAVAYGAGKVKGRLARCRSSAGGWARDERPGALLADATAGPGCGPFWAGTTGCGFVASGKIEGCDAVYGVD